MASARCHGERPPLSFRARQYSPPWAGMSARSWRAPPLVISSEARNPHVGGKDVSPASQARNDRRSRRRLEMTDGGVACHGERPLSFRASVVVSSVRCHDERPPCHGERPSCHGERPPLVISSEARNPHVEGKDVSPASQARHDRRSRLVMSSVPLVILSVPRCHGERPPWSFRATREIHTLGARMSRLLRRLDMTDGHVAGSKRQAVASQARHDRRSLCRLETTGGGVACHGECPLSWRALVVMSSARCRFERPLSWRVSPLSFRAKREIHTLGARISRLRRRLEMTDGRVAGSKRQAVASQARNDRRWRRLSWRVSVVMSSARCHVERPL